MDKAEAQNALKATLSKGDMIAAAATLRGFPRAQHFDVLHGLPDGSESSLDVAVYGLVAYLLGSGEDKAHWHSVASELLVSSLCHLPGAYVLGYYHACCAAELAPDDADSQEFVLFFVGVPDRVMETADIVRFAQRTLRLRPSSKVAQDALRRPFIL